jgi:hypothetical protein
MLQYFGWQDCDFMGDPNSSCPAERFSPDSIEIAPGDGLQMFAVGYPKDNYNDAVLITMFVWFSTQP